MTIIIATGGSGGHIFPAVRVAREILNAGHDIVFIGSFPKGQDFLSRAGFNHIDLNIRGFSAKSWAGSFGAAFSMIGATFRAIGLIKNIKPDAVIGFGGYGSVPAVLAASLLRKPTMIHEQNVVPGKANKLLARFVRKIAVSFPQARQYFPDNKTVLTGCPCHLPENNLNREGVLKNFRLKGGKKTILVSGGSQGSSRINEVFIEAVDELRGKLDFQVIHLSGKRDFENLRKKYNQIGIPFALYDFFDKMEEAYSAADLVISRSGAVTVSEIAGFGLRSIFVPYPHAHGHQRANAAVLSGTHLSRIIEDQDLSAGNLAAQVLNLIEQPLNTEEIKGTLKEICRADAAKNISNELMSLSNAN